MSQESTEPTGPKVNDRDSIEVTQEKLGNLIGPAINQFLDNGDVIFVSVVMVSSSGERCSSTYLPELREDMDSEERYKVEEARAVGKFQAAIQFGRLHSALSADTNRTLQAAIRNK